MEIPHEKGVAIHSAPNLRGVLRVAQTSPFMSAPQSSPRHLARRVFTKTESAACLAL